ncbi:acyl carrier protein, partial [Micromonospora sp. NPDC007271]|uniref:acyl carrier protein n=1 Tax=Micromonospora sp. NPDC007271 TaxID=3154587 RepID=UPI0033C50F5D
MTEPYRPAECLEAVSACLAEVLDLDPLQVQPDVLLTELGLESFTAVRLRRR